MDITIEKNPRLTIVSAYGKMDAANCNRLEEALDAIVAEGGTSIILNLEGLLYISSAGLRVLLKTAKKLHGSGSFALCALNDNIEELIEMSGFSHFMDIFPNIGEATSKLTA